MSPAAVDYRLSTRLKGQVTQMRDANLDLSRMLLRSCGFLRAFSWILSGEGFHEVERRESRLGIACNACFAVANADVVREGAEPKTKREGSAKPYLMVQFHPAPPLR